jgi:hypothetical protein
MEEVLNNFFEMDDELNVFVNGRWPQKKQKKIEDDHNFLGIEQELNFLENLRQPQCFCQ